MEGKKLNIVIWCGGAPNQKALANKIAGEFRVAGIVIDEHKSSIVKNKPVSRLEKIIDRIRFRKIYSAWKNLMHYYDKKYPDFPDVAILRVENINTEETEKFTMQLHPDVVAVSGTGLIREPLVNIQPATGILNLHTGLSPYVKGGPNCTNWCIANNQFDLIGNTIMWLNAGIDSGNIITTETVDILRAKDLDTAHLMVMEHAHDLYVRTLRYIELQTAPYHSVPQSEIGLGQLYLTKMWTAEKRKQLLKNWRNKKTFTSSETPRTIALST